MSSVGESMACVIDLVPIASAGRPDQERGECGTRDAGYLENLLIEATKLTNLCFRKPLQTLRCREVHTR